MPEENRGLWSKKSLKTAVLVTSLSIRGFVFSSSVTFTFFRCWRDVDEFLGLFRPHPSQYIAY